jgi:hypothetical protein
MKVLLANEKELELKLEGNISINIPHTVYYELLEYVKHYNGEVSGLGLVNRVEVLEKDGEDRISHISYIIEEVFLPAEQDNGSSTTEIDEKVTHELIQELVKQGKDVEKLKLHWHSHATMNVFHSGTDKENYNLQHNGSWLVSLVMNKDGDFLGRIDIYDKARISISNVPIYVIFPSPIELPAKVKDNIDKLDAYITAHKVTHVGYDWSGRDKDSKKEDDLKLDKETGANILSYERQQACSLLGIKLKEALKIEGCTTYANCDKCKLAEKCDEYNHYIFGVGKGELYEGYAA